MNIKILYVLKNIEKHFILKYSTAYGVIDISNMTEYFINGPVRIRVYDIIRKTNTNGCYWYREKSDNQSTHNYSYGENIQLEKYLK